MYLTLQFHALDGTYVTEFEDIMLRSPKGRTTARGLLARLRPPTRFHASRGPSLKTAQVNQKCRLTVTAVSTAIRKIGPCFPKKDCAPLKS
jgi:hypothetical protein